MGVEPNGPAGGVGLTWDAEFAKIIKPDGDLLGRFGEKGTGPGQYTHGPHALTLDSRGDLSVAEVGGEDQLMKLARVG